MWVQSLGQEDPLEEVWQPSHVFLPGESMGRKAWLQSMGSQSHSRLKRLSTHAPAAIRLRESNSFSGVPPASSHSPHLQPRHPYLGRPYLSPGLSPPYESLCLPPPPVLHREPERAFKSTFEGLSLSIKVGSSRLYSGREIPGSLSSPNLAIPISRLSLPPQEFHTKSSLVP